MYRVIASIVFISIFILSQLSGFSCGGGTATENGEKSSSEVLSKGEKNNDSNQREKSTDEKIPREARIKETTSDAYDAGNPIPEKPSFDLSPRQFKPIPSGNRFFTSLHFSGAKNCSQCHDNIRTSKGEDVSIVRMWSSTMMANASRDPFWWAKFRSELERTPKHKKLIEDKCTKCHAPMANHETKVQNLDLKIFEKDGVFSPTHKLYNHARGGVSCTVCHQIQDDPKLGTLAGFSGNYVLPKYTANSVRYIFGPYKNPFGRPMTMSTGFTPKYSPHIGKSKLCSTCHNLKTPFVDKDGNIVPKKPEEEFPEQMIYSEWEHSDYRDGGKKSTTCQNCHMPPTTDGVKISTMPPFIERRSPFWRHIFVGGNSFMLNIFKKHRTLLGITATNFDFTIKKTRENLRGGIQLKLIRKELNNSTLTFQLEIINKAGHKYPGGYPSRRLFLHVKVTDSNGKTIFESGKPRSDGSIEGADSDQNLTKYEPHYDVITKPDQVQIYEAIMANTEGNVTYTLLRAAKYLKDNRLLPSGFDKKTASDDIKVRGNAATDKNFIGGSDKITYKISGIKRNNYRVKITLYYQTLSFAYAQDLFKDLHLKEVRLFHYLWRNADFHVEPVAELKFSN